MLEAAYRMRNGLNRDRRLNESAGENDSPSVMEGQLLEKAGYVGTWNRSHHVESELIVPVDSQLSDAKLPCLLNIRAHIDVNPLCVT